MNQHKKFTLFLGLATVLVVVLVACTKYGDGFLSPYLTYAVNEFTITQGRTATSYSLNTDGSDIPMQVEWTHIYDADGNIVDDIFKQKYPVEIWTAAYNSKTDTDYVSIMAKRGMDTLPPLVVNKNNGTIEANPGTRFIPAGTYTMDLRVSNSAGTRDFDQIMKLVIQEGEELETVPGTGAFSNALALVGNAAGSKTLFNGQNNPLVDYTVTRFADTPNTLILKVTDRNGVPFNPGTGEITKRPATGLNPDPPYLQNLQDYAPDTYSVDDTAISIKYPLVPFPIASLGNGYNMYYNVQSQYIHIDSTGPWSNVSGELYQGPGDSHYLGMYDDDRYNYYIRIPMRIWVSGAYQITVRMLDVTHR